MRQRWGDAIAWTGYRERRAPECLPVLSSTPLAPLGAFLQPGQLVEITGAPGSGKSGLALMLLAALMQQTAPTLHASSVDVRRGLAAYVDTPRTFYPPSAAAMGIDLSRLWIVRLEAWRDTLAATEALLGSGLLDVVLWDLVGCRAMLTSGQLRRLRKVAADQGTTLLLLTSESVRPSGRALDYWAHVRLVVRRRELLWEQLGEQQLVGGYTLQIDVARAPGKPPTQPVELRIGGRRRVLGVG
jgi:RecA/RadA recombinase